MSKPKYYNGKTISEWAKETGLKRNMIRDRINEGWTIEEAVSIPRGERRRREPSIANTAKEHNMSPKTLKKRMAAGMSLEEALAYNYKKDYVGKKKGRLLVLKEIEPKRDPNGRARRQFLCLCDCGNETIALAEALDSGAKQSCGCYRRDVTSKMREKNLKGQTFGRLFVESEAFRDKLGIHWNVVCSCGNKKVVSASNLLCGNSTSCGCYNLEQISKREKAEIKNQRFGRLLAEECVGQNAYKNYLWKCLCDCGTRIVVPASRLITGYTQSCGCLISKGEETISKILSGRDIFFKKGEYFSDLKYKSVLKFDFALLDQNNEICLIEYQGIQHYEEQRNGFGDLQRKITDQMKRDYCFSHNIPLFEIRYDENIETRINEIIAQVNPVLNSDIRRKCNDHLERE